ncbi:hypothetical protein PSA7680_00985 [Pseudoruegeria aquimaris]|uniref:Uncharacterized protein n=1 Tax=Pseudoruegeria aquimaris TaxID=393663 RepID=A0A1Y5RTH2_9RHOB|nr:hypothetical protein [Pseudoruegeria aquimaris]SLN24043.1 hypothetical protein PSA7680_00985 [Pseudoruegeria aquimaris]
MACRVLTIGFALFYAAALFLFIVGTYGLFGQEKDPLSGVFLLPIGLPWIYLGHLMPDAVRPVLGAAAPAVNLALLMLICRARRNRR